MTARPAPGSRPPCAAIPTRINLALVLAHLAHLLYALFLFPLLVLPLGLWWALTLLPTALSANAYWSLLHEAIHGKLVPNYHANRALGRVMAVAFGSSFGLLQLGHLLHHKHNRGPLDRPDYYDPARTTPGQARRTFYFYLLGGLYLSELFAPLLFLLPRPLLARVVARLKGPDSVAGNAVAATAQGRRLREARIDALAAWAVLVASVFCYGLYAWLLGVLLLLRALLISFMDLAYHYGGGVGSAQGYDLSLPRVGEMFLLNFNYHGAHHREPSLPWTAIRERFLEEGREYDAPLLPAVFRQLRGPIPLAEQAAAKEAPSTA